MQKRIGSGQVCSNAPVGQETKRRKVLRSVWKPTEQTPLANVITVKESQSLPMRLQTAQVFDYLGTPQRIYADLVYSTTNYQLVRFINGPFCSSSFIMLSKATKALQASTGAPLVQWQYKQGDTWQHLVRPNFPNSVGREQAAALQNRVLVPEIEQALALEPSVRQVSALPFTRKPHFRNFSRRLLASCPARRLSELGFFRNGKASEKFSHCYHVEQTALQVQLNGICMLCQARPIDARYPCYHCVSCAGCLRWKTCPICDAF